MGQVLKNGLFLLDGYELTGAMNAIGLDYGADAQDDTRLGNDTHVRAGGLKTVKTSMKGFWDVVTDEALEGDVGASGALISIMANGAPAVGDVAYFFSALVANYQIGDAVGANLPFSANAEAQGDLIRGQLAAFGAKTASGTGTGLNLGALIAGQTLWASLHVVGVSGTTPNITVIVESSPDNTFASPTTVISFAAASAQGAQILSAAGPITDTWFRMKWTVTGTSPSLKIYGSIGID